MINDNEDNDDDNRITILRLLMINYGKIIVSK